ncbi:hypothetical protein ABXT06_18125, partial [Flavobacterium sp. UW10123]|uniref:hypothetical protein n=1 Tax=Flavobacterium sp. UW10123 TaxID=3230800 RepID=UPI00339B70E8
LFSLLFQSGCKTKTSFCFSQEKIEKILKLSFRLYILISLPVSQGTFRVLRGAKVVSLSSFTRVFMIFFLFFLKLFIKPLTT